VSESVPPIPPLSGELLEAVSSLVRAAHSYRSVLFMVAEDNPKAMETMLKHEDLLNLCDRIINGWQKHLAHDVEDQDST
jgi:hypothetical protein